MMDDSLKDKKPYVFSINISKGGIPKLPVDSVRIKVAGLEGDGHDHEKHYRLIQAVSLQDFEKLEELRVEGYPLFAGTTGENLTVKGLHVNSLPLGSVLKFPGGVMMELTKVRQPCYVLDSIHPQLKKDIISRCGVYAKVLQEGFIKTNDFIEVMIPSSTPLHQ